MNGDVRLNRDSSSTLNRDDFDAVVLDLDGVVTRTARLHARAWKKAFDEYLDRRTAAGMPPFQRFDEVEDYAAYVDGKPRMDGIRSFLSSMRVSLVEGDPDSPKPDTIRGIGLRKNSLYLDLLRAEGPGIYDDAVDQVRGWKALGLKAAIVSSSRNCDEVLAAAGLDSLFDVRVDGVAAGRLGLAGKPAPDIFLEAARKLGVPPERAVIFEDAEAGVRAGRRGGFGLVVGVDRTGHAEALRRNGADVVVSTLRMIRFVPASGAHKAVPAIDLPSALEGMEEIAGRLRGRRAVVFLDYDGTLTPIVSRPELAVLSESMRRTLKELAAMCTVAVVSGRDRVDVEKLVGLDGIVFAGSHGYDIAGPGGLKKELEEAKALLPLLDEVQRRLDDALSRIRGALVERKRFSVAVHYRNVAPTEMAGVEAAVDAALRGHEGLRRKGGKKVYELQPDLDWDKGAAVRWLLGALGLDGPDVLPFYAGDDLTDEDAFRELAVGGIGIVVGMPPRATNAAYSLRDTDDVERFLDALTGLVEEGTR
jgi:alpha,alpha-trehalase